MEKRIIQEMLDLPTKCVDKPFYCTENALSSMLGYLGTKISPETLHQIGCKSFDTALKCMPKKYETKTSNIDDLKNSINAGYPVLVSVVPDINIESGTTDSHTLVVIGYNTDGIYLLDECEVKHKSFNEFNREWERTKNITIINKEIVDNRATFEVNLPI